MNMPKHIRIGIVACIVLSVVCSTNALWEIALEGRWPKDWPVELQPLRKQSRTLDHTQQGSTYEIYFANREEFESVWPYILSLKSKDAPLILLRSPSTFAGATTEAGVRILSPSTGILVNPEGGHYPPGAESSLPGVEFLRIGPPWPDNITSKSGALPKYVKYENGKWAPYDNEASREMRRARIDIELIVDGKIVDLNRIPLPIDTQIIDKRFQERKE